MDVMDLMDNMDRMGNQLSPEALSGVLCKTPA